MAKRTTALNIETLIERPTIDIDGTLYEILSPDELSIIQHHSFAATGRRLEELMKSDQLDENEAHEMQAIVTDISDEIMVGVPDDIAEKLTDAQRLAVLDVFTALPAKKKLVDLLGAIEANQPKKTKRSTGAKRPRGSRGSSAATRKRGSTKRRSRSSGRTK